jgi:hypothetical protein
VAEADDDFRPPGVRPTASEPKANRFLRGFSHPTFFSGPLKPGACSPQTMRCRHSTPAHSARMATVQPDRFGAGSRTSEKSSAANLHVVSICTAARELTCSNWITRELTWSNWIVWLTPEPFPKAIMGDGRSRTLGDAWQHAIGNVIAGPAWCPTG